jgi:1-pyrroline-4-hydroxy-2-carboxylate deaminase
LPSPPVCRSCFTTTRRPVGPWLIRALFAALERGDYPKALEIYRWFMPLLHLDADHDLVQSIKLAEQVMGRGSERVLPPRYVLEGERRTQVIAMVEEAAANRPILGL